ncbi:MAG: DNA-directed RNA polymerase subunit omega [Clostridia bacterium]|nr:DNA-directed RNA polymerase subunit omega [Clostridia bacterium]
MSWLNPPIEKVIEQAGNKYILCSLVSKRAKELLLDKSEFFKENQKIKPIEYASKEFYEGLYTITNKSNKE